MDVRVIACSHVGYDGEKTKFDEFSGKMIGLTNTEDNLKTLMYEDNAKALRRSESAKKEFNRKCFDHESFTLYFEDMPKILSIIIDSQESWVKSEKISRFNALYLSKEEEVIYNKWIDLFKSKLAKIYKEKNKVSTDIMLTNLAESYAVYLKSVFSPVVVAYTTTYGEFNKLIGLLEDYIAIKKDNEFENKLSAIMIKFVMQMKSLPFYDKNLAKVNEKLTFTKNYNIEEYYGDVYAVSYRCSFLGLSEIILDKKCDYDIKNMENDYYVPAIIADNNDLKELWVSDLITLGNYPMATMLSINEKGTLDGFIDKYKMSLTGNYELLDINKEILNKYEYSLRLKMHSRAEELIKLNK